VCCFMVCCVMVPMWCTVGSAADEQALADQYAPILYFVSGEPCYPVDVSFHIDNSLLYQFVDGKPEVIPQPPKSVNLSGLGSEFSLDDQLGTIHDDGIIDAYQKQRSTLGYTVYAHVATSGESTVIQYWFFYAFNKGTLNTHEGDWEMVQVVITGGSPVEVMYSQHYSGQKATWDQVDHEGTHMKVYVAKGTHANYLRSYSGVVGVASDVVGADGFVLKPSSYTLTVLENQEWLGFGGHWGAYDSYEDELRGEVGPFGPMFRDSGRMWDDPLGWGNSLMQADNNIFLLEWLLYHFVLIYLTITLIMIAALAFLIFRRYKRKSLGPRILSMLYIDGLNLKSIGNILCILGIILAVLGLLYPWYCVSANIQAEGFDTGGLVDIIRIDGVTGVQVNVLDANRGPVQLGAFTLPFSLIIGVGLAFFIIGSIGVATSKKIGRKYLYRGIRLIVPIIMILIGIMAIGMINIQSMIGTDSDMGTGQLLQTMAGAPFGGQDSVSIAGVGTVELQWGICYGGLLLLFAGIILIISGVCEMMAKETFFKQKEEKRHWWKKKEPKEPPSTSPPSAKPPEQQP
jgi:hypothetical protein